MLRNNEKITTTGKFIEIKLTFSIKMKNVNLNLLKLNAMVMATAHYFLQLFSRHIGHHPKIPLLKSSFHLMTSYISA